MARKKEISIQARRRLFFLRPICLLGIFLVISFFAVNMYDIYKLNKEKAKKEAEYVELQEESEYLKNEIVKLRDPEYLAKFARENYSYSKNGEIVIQMQEKEEEKKADKDDFVERNTEILYLSLGIVVLVFIFIIGKGLLHKGNNKKSRKK
jgi:cell division protein FtsB